MKEASGQLVLIGTAASSHHSTAERSTAGVAQPCYTNAMKTPQELKAAIDTLLSAEGSLLEGWLVVFLAPPEGSSVEAGAQLFGRLFKSLAASRRMLVGGQQDPFRPRPHILHRIVVQNAKEARFDYFFFPEDEVVVSGYWKQTFPVVFPRESDISWLLKAAETAGMTLLPPSEGEE